MRSIEEEATCFILSLFSIPAAVVVGCFGMRLVDHFKIGLWVLSRLVIHFISNRNNETFQGVRSI